MKVAAFPVGITQRNRAYQLAHVPLARTELPREHGRRARLEVAERIEEVAAEEIVLLELAGVVAAQLARKLEPVLVGRAEPGQLVQISQTAGRLLSAKEGAAAEGERLYAARSVR